jgi:regulator of replication initiation timing
MADNKKELLEALSVFETQADLVTRSRDQAADAKKASDAAQTEMITLGTLSEIFNVKQIADSIREMDRQIQELVDNPGGLTELRKLTKESEVAFYLAAEKGDARPALANLRAAAKAEKERAVEVADLAKTRKDQIKSLIKAVKTIY